MKVLTITILLIILIGLTIPFVAGDSKAFTIVKGGKKIDTPLSKDVRKELIEFSPDPIKATQQRLGFIEKEKPAYVIIKGDEILGIIPETSKFTDINLHDVCLGYQYGTDNWYECEVSLQ